MRRILALLFIILMLGCLSKPDKIWLYLYPVGCTDNAWQQEWVVGHSMNFSSYPQGEDAEIFKAYLKARNVTILEFATEHYPIPQELAECSSCSCPRGDIFRVLVSDKDIKTATSAGLKEVLQEVYCNTDEDCIAVEDLCGCAKGGIRKPINKDFKDKWDDQFSAAPKCSGIPSDYPYCNQTLKPQCIYNECHIA